MHLTLSDTLWLWIPSKQRNVASRSIYLVPDAVDPEELIWRKHIMVLLFCNKIVFELVFPCEWIVQSFFDEFPISGFKSAPLDAIARCDSLRGSRTMTLPW